LPFYSTLLSESFPRLLAHDPDQGESQDPTGIFEKLSSPGQIIIVGLIESPVIRAETGPEELMSQLAPLVSGHSEPAVVPIENGLSSDLSKHFVSHLSSLPG